MLGLQLVASLDGAKQTSLEVNTKYKTVNCRAIACRHSAEWPYLCSLELFTKKDALIYHNTFTVYELFRYNSHLETFLLTVLVLSLAENVFP